MSMSVHDFDVRFVITLRGPYSNRVGVSDVWTDTVRIEALRRLSVNHGAKWDRLVIDCYINGVFPVVKAVRQYQLKLCNPLQ